MGTLTHKTEGPWGGRHRWNHIRCHPPLYMHPVCWLSVFASCFCLPPQRWTCWLNPRWHVRSQNIEGCQPRADRQTAQGHLCGERTKDNEVAPPCSQKKIYFMADRRYTPGADEVYLLWKRSGISWLWLNLLHRIFVCLLLYFTYPVSSS